MRILCISDIHGELDKFKLLLNKIKYDNTKDKLILLGDYIDRGYKSIETLFFVNDLIKKGAIALLGNHEEMFKFLINNNAVNNRNIIKQNGNESTIKQYNLLTDYKKKKIINIIDNLYINYVIDKYIFVHAGVNASVDLIYNTKDDFIWSRDNFIFSKSYKNKIVIFGHTPTKCINDKDTIYFDDIYKDKIGIDCGSVFGYNLACLEINNNKYKEYYV